MSRNLALILAPAAWSSVLSAASPIAAEAVQAVADYEGPHVVGVPPGLFAVAVGFMVAGAWLLWLSSRSRA